MRVRAYLLAAIGAVVVVGGIYLWLDVRGSDAAQPSAAKVAEAQARHARSGGPLVAAESGRPDRGDRRDRSDRVRPPRADAFGKPGGLPQMRDDLPGTDPAAFRPPPGTLDSDVPEKLRTDGAVQPPIDPDNPEIASAMTESNKMYDRGDYDGSRTLALKLLEREPGNVRMLRVVVSSSCIMGDADVAAKYWSQLPAPDQAQMSIRCARYQVSFPTPPTPQK